MIGQQIRHYRIESLLGMGGMGSVYLAVHTQLGRKIAIKIIHPSLARNPVVRERFRNEAAALSHLQHPNIVTLYDYSEEEDALYLFMEYVEGKTLDEYVQTVTGPVPEAKAIPLFAKLLDAVAYAHDRGVIHRDIKPSNIIVNDSGNAKILDFGIAKIVGQGLDGLTKQGTRMGTVLYMSPEQVRGEVLDKRSDIYSLGVTLFQLLTGRPPYDEANMTEYAVYQQILNEPLPRMRELYPLVSDPMQAIVDRTTAKDPAERFADCHQFREALMSQTVLPVAEAKPVPKPVEPSLASRKTPPAWQETIVIPEKKPAPEPARRRGATWVGVLLAVGILLSLLGIMVAMLPGRSERTASAPKVEKKAPVSVRSPKEQPPAEEQPAEEQQEVTETLPEPGPIDTQIVETPQTEDTAPARQLSNIQLAYEAIPPDSGSGGINRFALKIVLTNTSPDTAFNNVTLRIKFLTAGGQVIGTYIYEHGRLEPGATERFNVERRVQAADATCEVISAEPVKP